MDSKNFTAAEKHFEKKRIKLISDIKAKNGIILSQAEELTSLKNQLAAAEKEIETLREHNKKLLEYAQLTPEDISEVIRKEKKHNDALSAVMTAMSHLPY